MCNLRASTFRTLKEGHGEGRDLVVVTWKTQSGKEAGQVFVPVTGKGRTGPVSVVLASIGGNLSIPYTAGSIPNYAEWDTREFQWWKGLPFEFFNAKRPRFHSNTVGGVDEGPGGVRVWSQFICDGVRTTQEWFFNDLERENVGIYDCLITVRNDRKETLPEYGQFFACYTAWNYIAKPPVWDESSRKWSPDGEGIGHFYWSSGGKPVNYLDRGGTHLDFYVVRTASPFEKLGHIPHCPRGGGKVGDTWTHPVSVSQPGPGGYRHVVLCEEGPLSALACGMRGIAQDYLIYPPSGDFNPGEAFRVHIRHLLAKAAPDELPEMFEKWWGEFCVDHNRIRGLSRPVSDL